MNRYGLEAPLDNLVFQANYLRNDVFEDKVILKSTSPDYVDCCMYFSFLFSSPSPQFYYAMLTGVVFTANKVGACKPAGDGRLDLQFPVDRHRVYEVVPLKSIADFVANPHPDYADFQQFRDDIFKLFDIDEFFFGFMDVLFAVQEDPSKSLSKEHFVCGECIEKFVKANITLFLEYLRRDGMFSIKYSDWK